MDSLLKIKMADKIGNKKYWSIYNRLFKKSFFEN